MSSDPSSLPEAREVLGDSFARIADVAGPILDRLHLGADARVLDVGTGMGWSAILLALRGHRVLTGEPAADDSAYARKDWRTNAARVGVEDRIRFQPFGAEALPFGDESFDVIVYFGALHHMDEDVRPRALAEAARVLVPGGVALFVEPTAAMVAHLREHHHHDHPEPSDPRDYLGDLPLASEVFPGEKFQATLLRRSLL